MKPAVSVCYIHQFNHRSITNLQSGKAWFCTVLSAFGVVFLSVIGGLFYTNNEAMVGSINDPEDGKS